MRRSPLLLVTVGALLLAACGSSGSSRASSKSSSASGSSTAGSSSGSVTTSGAMSPGSTTASGAAPICRAKAKLENGKLVVTVEVPGPALAYATDPHATPSTGTVIIDRGKSGGTVTLNDSGKNPVKVTVYANRQSSSCTATPS